MINEIKIKLCIGGTFSRLTMSHTIFFQHCKYFALLDTNVQRKNNLFKIEVKVIKAS